MLKALGDTTRYAIYLELARSAQPLGTADVAEALGLHPNTVRPHLERMRDVGLLDVEVSTKPAMGRPQHLYSLAPNAPGLGLEPPSFPLLASMLIKIVARAGLGRDDAVEVGRDEGARQARSYRRAPSCLEAVADQLDRLGFDPQVAAIDDEEDTTAVIAFAHCPFRELAVEYPKLVCALHRGMVEGFVDEMGDASVLAFNSLEHRDPCQLTLASR